jgi:hypothetical protein
MPTVLSRVDSVHLWIYDPDMNQEFSNRTTPTIQQSKNLSSRFELDPPKNHILVMSIPALDAAQWNLGYVWVHANGQVDQAVCSF